MYAVIFILMWNNLIWQACQDLLLTYEAKQRALGVPVQELRVKPFESSLAEKPASVSGYSDPQSSAQLKPRHSD